MKSLFDNLWIILTVAIPGIVFYTIFRLLTSILEINIPFLTNILTNIDTSETLFIGVIITLGFVVQFFGIAAEEVAFKYNIFYKHKNKE